MGEATYGDKKEIEVEPMEITKTKKEEERN